MQESGHLNYENISIEYKFKRVRFLRLKLDNQGIFKLSIPKHCSKSAVLEFLDKNKQWLEDKNKLALKLKQKSADFYFLGQKYTLVFDESLKEAHFQENILKCKDRATLERLFKQNARKICLFYIEKYQKFIDRKVEHLSLKKMHTRWGSCNHKKGYINISLELFKKPTKLIEYVILHEMVHLIYPHHQKEFYDFLARLMPDFREREKAFKFIDD